MISSLDHRLELDRAHRAPQAPQPDGLSRDIIVKPHLYALKEKVMKASRFAEVLQIHGHKIQIFADISPYTIQKHHALKPLLEALTHKDVRY